MDASALASVRVSSRYPAEAYPRILTELAPTFARRAGEYDRNSSFPYETIADLVRCGYTSSTLGERWGGSGASLEQLCRAQEVLAAACGSSAFILNMHLHGIGMVQLMRDDPSAYQWALEAVQRGALIAGGFSEPGVGGNWWFPTTSVERVPGGYVMNGRKGFFTGFPGAELLFLTGALQEEGETDPTRRQAVAFIVPKSSQGIRIEREWDGLGMRATGSHSLVLENLFVPAECLVGEPGEVPVMFMKAVRWAWCSFSSCFLGIAQGALEHVVSSVKARKLHVLNKTLSHLPGVQFNLAEMRTRIATARALLYRTARAQQGLDSDPLGVYVRTSLAKKTICDLCFEAVKIGLQIMGGSGFNNADPISRMFRDVSAGLLVPPTGDVVLEWAGKLSLGVPLLAQPRWGG
ncbi:MAG TPA: acyl-CoA dehydrogenase family protein [Polyangiales bacterium]|nr:acyl-CoA dehydrogenase family protein [Polyangiales bacterium]